MSVLLLSGGACGGAASIESPPEPGALEVPTVMVPQVRPSEPDVLVWLGADRVLAIAGARAFVWEPSTDRVLLVAGAPWGARGPVRASSAAGIVLGSYRFLASSGRWEELPPIARSEGVTFAPDLEHLAAITVDEYGDPGDLLLARVGRSPLRIPIDGSRLAFSPDSRRVVTCGVGGAELRDADSGALLASWPGVAASCEWGDGAGPIVVFDDAGAVLLDPVTLTQIGGPIPDAQQLSVSADGMLVAFMSRQPGVGLAVLDVATRTTLLALPGMVAHSVRIRGDALAYEQSDGGGVVLVSGAPPVSFSAGLHVEDLGNDGRLFGGAVSGLRHLPDPRRLARALRGSPDPDKARRSLDGADGRGRRRWRVGGRDAGR